MSLQGRLHDFSAVEILQLLGSQRKTGRLDLETPGERMALWLVDGRLVSSRTPAPAAEDSLMRLLRRTQRIDETQYTALARLQRETSRDLEDLLRAGHYLTDDELTSALERLMFDDLSRAVSWTQGHYAFDPSQRWTPTALLSMNVESGLMEAARRSDELKRFHTLFADPHALLERVPDGDESCVSNADEEALASLVDGTRTVAELVDAAPMVTFECYDALARMLEEGMVRFSGRRETVAAKAPVRRLIHVPHGTSLSREVAVAVVVVLVIVLARLSAVGLAALHETTPANDVYAAAAARDLRAAVDLYARERGEVPRRLEMLAEDRWVDPRQLQVPGYVIRYRVLEDGSGYDLSLQPDR